MLIPIRRLTSNAEINQPTYIPAYIYIKASSTDRSNSNVYVSKRFIYAKSALVYVLLSSLQIQSNDPKKNLSPQYMFKPNRSWE
jgi:hypothetical protein